MFAIEIFAGLHAGSIALQADALDFLGDAATYAITLALLAAPIRWPAAAAFAKAASLGVFGIWILSSAVVNRLSPIARAAQIMGGVGLAALLANVVSAILLFHFRDGDANLRSVWLCSRNDALGNVAVIAAAGGVFATTTAWPDIAVGSVMAALSLSAALQIARHAWQEWHSA
jgi:Co/Zn/Cd efflux system component